MNTLSDKQREALARLAGGEKHTNEYQFPYTPPEWAFLDGEKDYFVNVDDWLSGDLDTNPLALYQLSLCEAKLSAGQQVEYYSILYNLASANSDYHRFAAATAPASIRARALLELIGEE